MSDIGKLIILNKSKENEDNKKQFLIFCFKICEVKLWSEVKICEVEKLIILNKRKENEDNKKLFWMVMLNQFPWIIWLPLRWSSFPLISIFYSLPLFLNIQVLRRNSTFQSPKLAFLNNIVLLFFFLTSPSFKLLLSSLFQFLSSIPSDFLFSSILQSLFHSITSLPFFLQFLLIEVKIKV
jgi:hypothetical protein